MFAIVLDDAWFDRTEPLSIDVRAGTSGAPPWAVQLFAAADESAAGAAEEAS
jgi:type VI secretion system protein ImpJ